MKWLALPLLLVSGTAAARDALGVYQGWGAFRDSAPLRCFAIAEPIRKARGGWRPFASVAHWPLQRVRGQIHIRMSLTIRPGSSVSLNIDGRRFSMVAGSADAWAADPRTDAAIVAAMRSGQRMTITADSGTTGRFADSYRLKGAATAIDAAALGCARGR